MAELADVVVHSRNKLTLEYATKLFVPNIPYSIKYPAREGLCGRPMSKQHTVSPAVVHLIETVWQRFGVRQVSNLLSQ